MRPQIHPPYIGTQKVEKPVVEGIRLSLADVAFSAALVPAVKLDAWKSAVC